MGESPELRRRLTAARRLGISLKRFDGWSPKQRTVVTEYTAQGWPARWETTTEPEWDPRERSLQLALAYYEAGICRRCGQHASKSMDPSTDPDNPEATHEWTVDGYDACHCCRVLQTAERKLADEWPEIASYALHIPALVPKKRPGLRPRKAGR